MSNSQQEASLSDSKRRRTNELVRMGRMVKETLSTDGWTKVGFPLLQKMIRSEVGCYKNGEWFPGNGNKDYAQALMDFSNRYYAYVKNINLAENTLKAMDEDEKEQYRIPMINEGSGY